MQTHPDHRLPAEHGLAYPPGFLDSLPVLQDRRPPHQPLRALDAAQFAQIHLAHTTAHAPDAVLFPFLHGIEGQNHAQNAFFAHARTHPAAPPPVPRFRGLVWVAADELDMEEAEVEGEIDELDEDVDDEDDFSSSESLESFGPMDIDVEVDGEHAMAMDDDGIEPDGHPPPLEGDKAHAANGITHTEHHHHVARHTPPPPKSVFLTSSFRARELLQTRAAPGGGLKHTFLEPSVPDGISLRNFGIQVPVYATLSDIVIYSPRGDTRSAHALAAAFKDAVEAKYAARAARMNAAAAVYTSPSSSASSSPSPPASPSTRPDARQKQDMPVPEHVHPDLDGGECLLKYNVFVLDASPAEVEAKLPQLVARPEPPMQTAAHTDGTDAHTQGEGAEEAWRRRAARPNIVDFAIREREEMRDLTRASELITVLPPRESAVDSSDEEDEEERVLEYSGTTPAMRFDPLAGQVFLGNAHDAPPTHPGASIPFTPGANAPKLGRGFDLCIECYDYAPLPTMAQLRAAEGQVAALDRAWVEHCLAEDDENDGEGRDGKDGEELPPRPPPHHSAVVHLTFPSSPASTAASVNAVLPVLAFLERLIAPPSSPPTRAAARALLFPSPLHSQPPQHGPRRASEAASFGPRSLPPPSAFPTSFFPNAHAHGPQTAYTRMRSTSATCPPGSSSPAPPSSPGSSASSASSPTVDLTAALRTRPAKILIHSADGYTESSVLGLTLLMAHRALALPAAYLTLQLEKRRSFFVYQADIPLLRRIEARLQRERAAREQEARETGGVGWGAHKPQERGAGSPGPASAPESRAPWGSWSRVSSKSVSFAPGSDTPVRGEALPVVSHPCRTVSESYSAVSVEAFAVHSRPRAQTLPPALPDVVGAHQLWFNDPRFDGSFPSRVLPFLYLGNLNHASNAFMLHALGITHVVSVGECALVPPPEDEAPAQSGKCTLGSLWHEEREGRIKVLDIKGVCDDGIDTLAPQLEPICEWIERARAEGGTVLVHCRVGVSRSATVTIAYVMKHLQLPLVDAYLIVRSRRLSVLIQPNMRLLYNLLGWELHLARERAAGNEERLRYELARCLNWPYLAKEVHALNEKYLH